MDKQREKLIELIEDALASWNRYLDECAFEQEAVSFTFEQLIADNLLANGVIVPCDTKDYSKIPMQENDAGAKTVGEYLKKLLLTLWDEKDYFSSKRPFGNRSWEYEIYAALISSEVIMGSFDEEGYIVDVDCEAADRIIREIISREDAEKALAEKGGADNG